MADVNKFTTPAALGSLDIRVVTIDAEPWFITADVIRVLGMATDKGTGPALRPLDADERRLLTPKSLQGLSTGSATAIAESGLYKLLMRAQRKNPAARIFQDSGTELVRQYRQLGQQQVHVNVYPRALLERTEARLGLAL